MHAGVLETQLEHGYDWTMAVWNRPSQDVLFKELRTLMEATLLAALSQLPARKQQIERLYISMSLLQFRPLPYDLEQGLGPLSFREMLPFNPDHFKARTEAFRPDALRTGTVLPSAPARIWSVPIHTHRGTLGDQLRGIQGMMSDRMGPDVLGATPGGPSRLFADLAGRLLGTEITPTLEGLNNMELLLVQEEDSGIRWVPPLLFQALCDFIGVLLRASFGLGVEWALCEAGPNGLPSPPMFRITAGQKRTMFPVGHWLLRRIVMPDPDVQHRIPLSDHLKAWHARVTSGEI